MSKQIKTKENKPCELVASVHKGNMQMYGQTLEEVCQLYEHAIRNKKHPLQKALERTRYVEFILHHIAEFDNHRYPHILGKIIILCDCAISTLSEVKTGERMPHPDAVRILKRSRKLAATLLEQIQKPLTNNNIPY